LANPRANHAKVVAVSTKDNFRRPVPKTYSYRYEVAADAGPAGEPLIGRGAAIIESRYRGRGASWQISRSPVSDETYTVNGSYVHPLAENPMAYPPRTYAVPPPPAPVPARQHAPKGHATIEHQPRVAAETLVTERYDSRPAAAAATPPKTVPGPAPSSSRRERPTPANEPAYRKTG
jgi:hypothetical protein